MKADLRGEAHNHPGNTIIAATPWFGRNATPIDRQADNRDTGGLPMRISTMNTEKIIGHGCGPAGLCRVI